MNVTPTAADDHLQLVYALMGLFLVAFVVAVAYVQMTPPAPLGTPPANKEMYSYYEHDCDATQAIELKPAVPAMVGHIEFLKIGKHEFGRDLEVPDPMDPDGGHKKVVGLLTAVWSWGRLFDEIRIKGEVPDPVRQELGPLSNVWRTFYEVDLAFTVYRYDTGTGRYYKAFHTGDIGLRGSIYMDSPGSLDLGVLRGPIGNDPERYEFMLFIRPLQDQVQAIHDTTVPGAGPVRYWGGPT